MRHIYGGEVLAQLLPFQGGGCEGDGLLALECPDQRPGVDERGENLFFRYLGVLAGNEQSERTVGPYLLARLTRIVKGAYGPARQHRTPWRLPSRT